MQILFELEQADRIKGNDFALHTIAKIPIFGLMQYTFNWWKYVGPYLFQQIHNGRISPLTVTDLRHFNMLRDYEILLLQEDGKVVHLHKSSNQVTTRH